MPRSPRPHPTPISLHDHRARHGSCVHIPGCPHSASRAMTLRAASGVGEIIANAIQLAGPRFWRYSLHASRQRFVDSDVRGGEHHTFNF